MELGLIISITEYSAVVIAAVESMLNTKDNAWSRRVLGTVIPRLSLSQGHCEDTARFWPDCVEHQSGVDCAGAGVDGALLVQLAGAAHPYHWCPVARRWPGADSHPGQSARLGSLAF